MTKSKSSFPSRTAGIGVVCCAVGFTLAGLPEDWYDGAAGGWLIVGGVVLVAGAVGRFAVGRHGSSAIIDRWDRRSQRNEGVASTTDILRVASSFAMRRRAKILRPSLGELSHWKRWRTPLTEIATPVARVGRWRIWSPVEDVTLRLGGPRTGKTGEIACRIIDAPGAVVATSTRTDIVGLTAASRAKVGPVSVFNPSGLGGLSTTIKFSPLVGCRSPRTAMDRATDLIGVSGEAAGDREFWNSQARRVLAVLMHAAAIGDRTMQTVLSWVARPEDAKEEVMRLLDSSPNAVTMRDDASGFFDTNDRTRSSITTSIMPALGWLTDVKAAAVAEGGNDEMLDVEEFLRLRGTLYVLGAEDAIVAPLVAALTSEIARQARWLASDMPGGRLDPPLTLVLDEAALICPVPLDRWTADMGGRNITIHIAAQSKAQLRQRWGDDGASAIMNNCATILIYGGTRDPDDLAVYSTLSGDRREHVKTVDDSGNVRSTTPRPIPVLSPSQIANLPAGYVMVIRRGMPVSVGRTLMAWDRRDVRKVNKRTPFVPVQATSYEEHSDRLGEWANVDERGEE